MAKIFSFIRLLGSSFIFPFLWTIIIIALLCIPGKALPGMGIFGIKHLDKLIHIFLFGSFVVLWGIYAWVRKTSYLNWLVKLSFIVLASIAVGVIMEYVQEAFVPNRSFDVWDIWADFAGSLLIMYLLWKYGKKWNLLV